MKTVQVALAIYARGQAANEEADSSTPSTETPRDSADDAANHPTPGWDPFEVWRTRIKTGQKSDS
jgi:hypothetical protein